MLERNAYIVREAKRLAEEKHRSSREIAEELKAKGASEQDGNALRNARRATSAGGVMAELERGIEACEARKQATAARPSQVIIAPPGRSRSATGSLKTVEDVARPKRRIAWLKAQLTL